jgi:hypothetical protein
MVPVFRRHWEVIAFKKTAAIAKDWPLRRVSLPPTSRFGTDDARGIPIAGMGHTTRSGVQGAEGG